MTGTGTRYLLVAVGGALGSMARFFVGSLGVRVFGPAFPYGTIAVNLLGSFLLSVVMGIALNSSAIPENTRIFLSVGIMGGFTTYSGFNYEMLALLQQRMWLSSGLNLIVTVVGCLMAGLLGLLVARLVVGSSL